MSKGNTTMKTTITHNGSKYTAEVGPGGAITITRDGVVSGTGLWMGSRIENCAATLDEQVYELLDMAIQTEQASALRSELERVFASPTEVRHLADERVEARLDAWPEPITYRAHLALKVLARYRDGAGEDERGDAEVCRALEANDARHA